MNAAGVTGFQRVDETRLGGGPLVLTLLGVYLVSHLFIQAF